MTRTANPDSATLPFAHQDLDAFERLFKSKHAIQRHREAPLFCEREAYFKALIDQKMSKKALRDTAAVLLHVIRLLDLSSLRQVGDQEMKSAGCEWAREKLKHRKGSSRKSALSFNTAARGWLRFHDLFVAGKPYSSRFDPELGEFRQFLIEGKGYGRMTIQGVVGPVSRFLFWAAKRNQRLTCLSHHDLDMFLDEGRCKGWKSTTVRSYCLSLRIFFCYAEGQGWCRAGLSRTIVSPVVRKKDCEVMGPAWKDVRRMIKTMPDLTPVESRAKAILLLSAVYGLRNIEMVGLKLQDIDWFSETFIVKRAKRGGWQRLPLRQEVGDAIIHYLRTGRPQCAHRNVFLTSVRPYRPLSNLAPIVQLNMRKAGIKSQAYGTHALRHACATELLRKGTSLQNIAAYLGHRGIRSVSIYAKYDQRSLRRIANFSLLSVL